MGDTIEQSVIFFVGISLAFLSVFKSLDIHAEKLHEQKEIRESLTTKIYDDYGK